VGKKNVSEIVSEGLGERKVSEFCPCPSLKRDFLLKRLILA